MRWVPNKHCFVREEKLSNISLILYALEWEHWVLPASGSKETTVGIIMSVFVVVKNRTLEFFVFLDVAFSELLNFTIVCELWGVLIDNGTLELISVAEASGWLSKFNIDIKVWFQKAGSCSSIPDPTVDI